MYSRYSTSNSKNKETHTSKPPNLAETRAAWTRWSLTLEPFSSAFPARCKAREKHGWRATPGGFGPHHAHARLHPAATSLFRLVCLNDRFYIVVCVNGQRWTVVFGALDAIVLLSSHLHHPLPESPQWNWCPWFYVGWNDESS